MGRGRSVPAETVAGGGDADPEAEERGRRAGRRRVVGPGTGDGVGTRGRGARPIPGRPPSDTRLGLPVRHRAGPGPALTADPARREVRETTARPDPVEAGRGRGTGGPLVLVDDTTGRGVV